MSQLYEHGTLAMLMSGLMGGTMTLEELLTHGDTGIGTFHDMDGELAIINGHPYQATSDGHVREVTDLTMTVPFASVHWDEPATASTVALSETSLENIVTRFAKYRLRNVFASIMIRGTFKRVDVRATRRQKQPYPEFLEVTRNQPEFTAESVSGVVVGYFAPKIFEGPTTAGWHLHFLSDGHDFGGHILDLTVASATAKLMVFDDFVQHLPVENGHFRDHVQKMAGLRQSIREAEGGQS